MHPGRHTLLLVAPQLWPWLEPAQSLLYTTSDLGVDIAVNLDRASLNRNVYGWGERWQTLVVASEDTLLEGLAAEYAKALSQFPYPPQRCVFVAVEASVSRRFQRVDARFSADSLEAGSLEADSLEADSLEAGSLEAGSLEAASVVRCTLGRAGPNTEVIALAGLLRALAEHGDDLAGEYVLDNPRLDRDRLARLLHRQQQRLATVYDDLDDVPHFTVSLHDPDTLLSRLPRSAGITLPRSLATLHEDNPPPDAPSYRWLWRDDFFDWQHYRDAHERQLRALRDRLTDATNDALGNNLDKLALIVRQRKTPVDLTPRDLDARRQQLERDRDALTQTLYKTPLPQPSLTPDEDAEDDPFEHRLWRTLASRPGFGQVFVAVLLGFFLALPSALLTTNQPLALASLGAIAGLEIVVIATVRGRIQRRLRTLHDELDHQFGQQLRALADYRDAFEARLQQRLRLWLVEQQLRDVVSVQEQTSRERLARQFHRDAIARHHQHAGELLADLPDVEDVVEEADTAKLGETDLDVLQPPSYNSLYNPLTLPTTDTEPGVLILGGRSYPLNPAAHQGVRELRLLTATPPEDSEPTDAAPTEDSEANPEDANPEDAPDES